MTAGQTGAVMDSAELRAVATSLLRLTERYCVVYQTLARPAELAVSAGRATATT